MVEGRRQLRVDTLKQLQRRAENHKTTPVGIDREVKLGPIRILFVLLRVLVEVTRERDVKVETPADRITSVRGDPAFERIQNVGSRIVMGRFPLFRCRKIQFQEHAR